jgi:hypothetical protein
MLTRSGGHVLTLRVPSVHAVHGFSRSLTTSAGGSDLNTLVRRGKEQQNRIETFASPRRNDVRVLRSILDFGDVMSALGHGSSLSVGMHHHGDPNVDVARAQSNGHGHRPGVRATLLDYLSASSLKAHKEDSAGSPFAGVSGLHTAGNFAGEHGAVSLVSVLFHDLPPPEQLGLAKALLGGYTLEWERIIPSRVYPTQIKGSMPTRLITNPFTGDVMFGADPSNMGTNPLFTPLVVPTQGEVRGMLSQIEELMDRALSAQSALIEGAPDALARLAEVERAWEKIMRDVGRTRFHPDHPPYSSADPPPALTGGPSA